MGIVDRIRELCDNRHTNFAEVERSIGISNGQIRRWDKVSPKTENIQKVADYFDVSVDYLLGRTNNSSTKEFTSESETELRKALENVMSFDGEKLTENDKDAIIAYMMGRKGK